MEPNYGRPTCGTAASPHPRWPRRRPGATRQPPILAARGVKTTKEMQPTSGPGRTQCSKVVALGPRVVVGAAPVVRVLARARCGLVDRRKKNGAQVEGAGETQGTPAVEQGYLVWTLGNRNTRTICWPRLDLVQTRFYGAAFPAG
uniref:Uncharacterized protein n=1 Tax=Cacopsylla melanoneura TaxID=428564 RepID=A0A8D8LG67_9HEMI